MKAAYIDTIILIERLHRQCLETVKAELDRLSVRDLNAVQAMILFNLGDTELTVGELTQRGYYLGSNVSYNVKKMTENGYLLQERSPHDRRAVHLRASKKGLEICALLDGIYAEHANRLDSMNWSGEDIEVLNERLRGLEDLWASERRR